MKKISLLTLAILTIIACSLHAQTFSWASNFGGADNDGGSRIATDALGNNYVAGYFNSSATFGTTTLTSAGSKDAFLAKYNAAGICLWAVKIGGTGNDEATAIAVDASGGVFVAGYFASPTLSTAAGNLANSGGDDIFFIKFNSIGVAQYAAKAGGSGYEKCLAICTNTAGEMFATGYISGSTPCTFGVTTLTGTGVSSMFIAKYDAALASLWAQKAGGLGSGGNVRGTGIAVDFSGAPFVCGPFLWGADFVTQQFNAIGNTDMFFAKYTTSGSLSAAYQYYGTTAGSRINPAGLKTDASGFCYIAGSFSVNAVLGSTTLTSNGLDDVLLVKINAVGNVQWAASAGGIGDDRATGVAVDAMGNAYLSGYLDGSFNFGSVPVAGNSGSPDVFVAKYNTTAAAWQWVLTGGSGLGYEYAYDIAISGSAALVITGQADAAFALGSYNVLNAGFNDGFIAGVSLLAGVYDFNNQNVFDVAPNPSGGLLHVTFPTLSQGLSGSPIKIEVLNTTGAVVFMQDVKPLTGNSLTLDLSKHELENGIYFLRVSDEKTTQQQKIIIAH